MNEKRFRELVRLAVEAEHLDDPAAEDPRTPLCLSMGHLDQIAMNAVDPTPAEKEHLASCELCSGRLKALRKLVEKPTGTRAQHARKLPGRWTVGLSITALAAVVALLVMPWSAWSPNDEFGFRIRSVSRATRSEGRTEREFLLSTEHPCWIFVVYRTWNAELGQLDWTPHIWADGSARTELHKGETIRVTIDVTSDPLVEQTVVVAASGTSVKLPTTVAEAEHVTQCLRREIVPARSDEKSADYHRAMEKCLPGASWVEAQHFNAGGE